jgi:hypothetical protein
MKRISLRKRVMRATFDAARSLSGQNNSTPTTKNKFVNHGVVRLKRPDSDFNFEPGIFDPSYGKKYDAATRAEAEQQWQEHGRGSRLLRNEMT